MHIKPIQKEAGDFLSGVITQKDEIAPSYINLINPKYIEIDNNYYSTLIIVNYFREQKIGRAHV